MAKLREAFPDIAQIDRRMRGLRDYGWEIATAREDPELRSQERRFVTRGKDVWVPGQAKTPSHKSSITSAQRAKVMQEDGYLCRTCGITGGEAYDDDIIQAVLNVAHAAGDSGGWHRHAPARHRMPAVRAGATDRSVDLPELIAKIEALAPLERSVLNAG